MPLDDIGYLIFVEILKITEYPGPPFTGDIIRDLVMFLLIPSVFIILFVYMLLGRMFLPQQSKLRLLLGVSIYLFIWAGGYFRTFALLAGPYFIFLIFVLGLIYFIPAHLGVRQEGGVGGGVAGGGSLLAKRRQLMQKIERLHKQIARAEARGEGRPEALRLELAGLEAELEEVDADLFKIGKLKAFARRRR